MRFFQTWKASLATVFIPDKHSFQSIHGIRALSCIWLVIGHSVALLQFFLTKEEYYLFVKNTIIQIAGSAPIAVDAFFTISGFLIGYALLNELKNTGSVSVKSFLIKRAARIYPVFVVVLILSFPFYFQVAHTIWANILFMNNFIETNKQYLPWTWAIAVEVHCYLIISILFLVMPIKHKKFEKYFVRTISFLILIPIIALLVKISIDGVMHFHPNELYWENEQHLLDVYVNKTYFRFAPFWIGVLTAFSLVFKSEQLQRLVSTKVLSHNLVTALLSMIALVVGMQDPIWTYIKKLENVWQNSILWFIGMRYIFSLFLAGIIICAFYFKKNNFVINFLCLPLWYFISKISYSLYLVHPTIIFCVYKYHESMFPMFSLLDFSFLVFNVLIFSILISFFLVVFIEIPFRNKIRKYWLSK